MIRLAINGFGRIGRTAFKVAVDKHASDVEIVAINDLMGPETLAHLLKYDSVYGVYNRRVSSGEKNLIVDDKKFLIVAEKEPVNLPWGELQVDVVIESTGRFTKSELAQGHVKAGAKRVVISAPSEDAPTHILGVNPYDGQAQVINNGSCTTNCVGPVTAVMHANFKILKAFMTTVHAYTAEQNLVDGPPPPLHKDLRRARAAAVNIVPTTTGAAKAVARSFPEMEGKFDGAALRVPVVCGSVSDFTFLVEKKTTVEEVNQVFKQAVENPLYKGILAVTEDPIVSTDIIGRSESAIVDLPSTKVVDGDLVRVLAWYDNEWGYANRLIEQVIEVGRKIS
ncbi:type I glyceraldehyde-3-phosphate dehydrogenase [Candidatus Woesebacteria bacterium]|nr:type I glyceraldehyde-3-phosphate dehydrogenase [Candidatus Woesebacteria bacterium]